MMNLILQRQLGIIFGSIGPFYLTFKGKYERIITMMIIGLTLLQAQVPEKIKSKSIPLGVGLSTVLPGAGQWYNGIKVQGSFILPLKRHLLVERSILIIKEALE